MELLFLAVKDMIYIYMHLIRQNQLNGNAELEENDVLLKDIIAQTV